MKKIISCLVSIVLVLQLLGTASFGVWADETNKYSTCYVKFVLDDSTKYIKTIIKDECLMVNAQWLSGLLGLEYKTKSDFLNSAADLGNTLVSPVTDKYNYFAEKLGADDVTIFKNDVERFTISKKDSNLKFTFEVGKSTAAATSRAYGKMSVDLGTEVTAIEDEEGHKQYYVPLFMVCNIFNVVYYIEPQDEGNCIVLTDPQLTVVDIMHMQYKLEQYKTSNCLYDALNDDFLTRLEMVIPGTVDNALEYILSSKWLETPIGLAKDTFLSYLNTKDKSDRFWWLFDTAFDIAEYTADVKDEIKDPSFIYAGNYEMITCQMCSSDTNEIESMIGDSSDKLNTVIDGYSEFYGKMIEHVKKSCESGFLKKKTDLYEEILNNDNKISLFEFEKCYDKYNNLVAVNKVAKVSEVLNTSAATAASVLFEDIALKAEISAVQDEYIENMKTYLKYADSYVTEENRGEHVYIKRRIDLYESSTTDVFGDIASKSIATESIDSISGKICDFQLGKLSLAHGITKWGVNELTDGAFDFKDAYFNCLCCLEFRNATKTVLDQYMTIESSFDIETYRDLEWIRLKSYYVANKNELDMYAQYCSVAEETAKSNRTLAELREIGLEEKEKYTNAEKAEFAKRIKEKDVNFEIDIDGAFEDYYIMTEAQNIYNNEKSVIDLETRELSEYMAVLLYGVEGTTPEYIALCEEYAQSDNEYVIENDCALYQQIECTVVDSEDNVGVVGAELEFSVENGVKATVATGEDGKVINIEAYIPVGLYNLKVTALGYENYEYESKIEVKIDEQCKIGEIILEKSNFKWHLKPSVEADDIIVSDLIYDTSNGFNASYECAVIEQNGFYGVINNTTGKILIQPEFTYFKYETLTGYIVVANDNYTTEDDYTICNGSSGIEVVDSNICERGWEFEDYYVDSLTGQIYVDGYGSGILFSDNHNVVVRSISGSYNENTGFYQFDYETIGSKYGIGGKDGLIVKCDYDDAKSQIYPENSNLIALAYDSKWGYFDENGEKIIDFICEPWENLYNSNILESRPFLATGGYIPVKINSKCGYYDTEGNEIIPVGTFAEVRPVHNKLAWVKDTATGLWGVIELVEEETIASPPSESLENDDAWKNLYRNELLRYMRSSDYTSDVMFDLYDLDGNGVPELLISQGAAHVSSCIIYTVYQGTLINIGNYGVYGSVEYSQKYRLLAAQNSHMGYWHGYYYSIAADGTMTEQFSFDTNWAATSNEDELYYIINGTNVTSEEFDAAIAEYDDGEWISVGRKYEFSEEEILSALT